jgi:acyl carrier protein
VPSTEDIFQFVVRTLASKCRVNPAFITPATDIFKDLGVDSAEFLDATFVIEDEYAIRMPVGDWMGAVNAGEAPEADHFRVDNFVAAIADLIAQGPQP